MDMDGTPLDNGMKPSEEESSGVSYELMEIAASRNIPFGRLIELSALPREIAESYLLSDMEDKPQKKEKIEEKKAPSPLEALPDRPAQEAPKMKKKASPYTNPNDAYKLLLTDEEIAEAKLKKAQNEKREIEKRDFEKRDARKTHTRKVLNKAVWGGLALGAGYAALPSGIAVPGSIPALMRASMSVRTLFSAENAIPVGVGLYALSQIKAKKYAKAAALASASVQALYVYSPNVSHWVDQALGSGGVSLASKAVAAVGGLASVKWIYNNMRDSKQKDVQKGIAPSKHRFYRTFEAFGALMLASAVGYEIAPAVSQCLDATPLLRDCVISGTPAFALAKASQMYKFSRQRSAGKFHSLIMGGAAAAFSVGLLMGASHVAEEAYHQKYDPQLWAQQKYDAYYLSGKPTFAAYQKRIDIRDGLFTEKEAETKTIENIGHKLRSMGLGAPLKKETTSPSLSKSATASSLAKKAAPTPKAPSPFK